MTPKDDKFDIRICPDCLGYQPSFRGICPLCHDFGQVEIRPYDAPYTRERRNLANLHELIQNSYAPKWLNEMREHYARTGTYRPEDIARLLGDQTKGVSMPMVSDKTQLYES